MSEERKKRRWRLVAIVIALLAIIVFGGRILIGKILLSRIQTSVKENLNANLSADSLSYRPPYSFVLHHCHFELPHHDAPPDLIDVAELRVTLDRLPFGGGPVLVKEIHMIDPVVQVAKSPAKIIDLQSLTSGSSESEEENGKKKPSQIVQIGRLKIEGGQILLQDSTPQRNTWAKIQLNMDATAASPSDYNFKITEAGPIARFDSDGSANVDHRIVSLDQFSFAADMNAPAPAADPLEQLIQQNHLRGYLGVNGTLYINSRHPAQNHGWVALTAKDVSGNLPVADTSIDALQLNAVASADRQGAMLSFSKFFVKSGQTSLGLDGGMIKTTGGALHATGLTGEYGDDRFTTSMDWPLISAEHGIVRLTNIDGVMNFHPPIADYPDPLDKIFGNFVPPGHGRSRDGSSGISPVEKSSTTTCKLHPAATPRRTSPFATSISRGSKAVGKFSPSKSRSTTSSARRWEEISRPMVPWRASGHISSGEKSPPTRPTCRKSRRCCKPNTWTNRNSMAS